MEQCISQSSWFWIQIVSSIQRVLKVYRFIHGAADKMEKLCNEFAIEPALSSAAKAGHNWLVCTWTPSPEGTVEERQWRAGPACVPLLYFCVKLLHQWGREGCELKRVKCISADIEEVFLPVFIWPDFQQGFSSYRLFNSPETLEKPWKGKGNLNTTITFRLSSNYSDPFIKNEKL